MVNTQIETEMLEETEIKIRITNQLTKKGILESYKIYNRII